MRAYQWLDTGNINFVYSEIMRCGGHVARIRRGGYRIMAEKARRMETTEKTYT